MLHLVVLEVKVTEVTGGIIGLSVARDPGQRPSLGSLWCPLCQWHIRLFFPLILKVQGLVWSDGPSDGSTDMWAIRQSLILQTCSS